MADKDRVADVMPVAAIPPSELDERATSLAAVVDGLLVAVGILPGLAAALVEFVVNTVSGST